MLVDAEFDLMSGPQLPAHFYVHVPFCTSKCSYCDFASVAHADEGLISAVSEGIRAELRRWGSCGLPGVVDTLYIGGGTPTHVLDHTLRILGQAERRLPMRQGAEITVEANPESMSPTSARRLAAAGVTRLSLGVQSFDDAVLRLLGRAHDARTAAAAAAAAVDAGLSLSVDLMCGIPGQTVTSWQETLDRAVRTGAEHVSVYPLALESGTPLAVACDTGLVGEPDVDAAADMMLLAEDLLTAAGILRYETANYARPGLESRHNNAYWTGRGYLGIGPAAHGMLDAAAAEAIGLIPLSASCISDGDVSNGRSRDAEKVGDSTGERVPGDMRSETIARVRYWEASDPQAWLLGPPKGLETLTKEEAQREDIMLGMRLRDGVSALEAHEAGLDAVFETLEAEGLVERAVSQGAVREGRSAGVAPALPNGGSASSSCSTRWRTTRRGWLLGNEVFGRLWAGG